MHSRAATAAKATWAFTTAQSSSNSSKSDMGVHDCQHGPRAYKLGLVTGQHIDRTALPV